MADTFDPNAYLAKYSGNNPTSSGGFDPNAYLQKYSAPEEPGLLSSAIGTAQDIGEGAVRGIGGAVSTLLGPAAKWLDKYAGSPVRAAVGASIDKQNPVSAYANQFGQDPENAPTGQELAHKLGAGDTSISDVVPSLYSESGEGWKLKRGGLLDATSSGAIGTGLDVALDPTNIIPAGYIAKGVGKAVKPFIKPALEAGELAGKGLLKGTEAVLGTKALSRGLEVGKDALNTAKDTAVGTYNAYANPVIRKEYPKLLQTAQEIGLKPEDLSKAVSFGDVSVPSREERMIAGSPGGQELLNKHNAVIDKIENSIKDTVTEHSGGKIMDPLSAGELLKDSYAEQQKKILSGNDITYRNAADLTPNMQITEAGQKTLSEMIGGLKKRASGYLDGGTTEQKTIGRDLNSLATSLSKKGSNYRQLADQIGFIGEAAFDPSLNYKHASELKGIYKKLSGVLIDAVGDIHPDLAADLKGNNKKISEFFKSSDALGKAIQNSSSNPETLFRSIAGDAGKIAEIKKIAPDNFNTFRGSYLDSLVKKNSDGRIAYESSLKAIENNRGRLKLMFTPEELASVENKLKLGKAQGAPFLSTSPEGGLSMLKNTIEGNLVGKNVLKRSEGLLKPKGLKEATITPTPVEGAKGLIGKVKSLKRGPLERLIKGTQVYNTENSRE